MEQTVAAVVPARPHGCHDATIRALCDLTELRASPVRGAKEMPRRAGHQRTTDDLQADRTVNHQALSELRALAHRSVAHTQNMAVLSEEGTRS